MTPEQHVHWPSVTRREGWNDELLAARDRLADAARAGDWTRLFAELDAPDGPLIHAPHAVNAPRPGGRSWYAPLHQAAHHGAPAAVVNGLLDRGAWRTLRAAGGQRPADIARSRGHTRMLDLLEPHPRHPVPDDLLTALQDRLHELMDRHTRGLPTEHALRLPQLSALTELPPDTALYCPVPGMFGGFRVWFGADDSLMADATTRTDYGQGPLFRIRPDAVDRVGG